MTNELTKTDMGFKILIVEDNANDAELLLHQLRQDGLDVDKYTVVERPEDFSDALDEEKWDVILSDYSMPHFSGPDALELLKSTAKDIPFIIVSGTVGEETAVECMKAGANDFLIKGQLLRLTPAITREIQEARNRKKQRTTEWELSQFVASLTHDLRAPVLGEERILKLFLDGSLGDLSEDQSQVLEELLQGNQFVQHMVDNILQAYKYRQNQITLDQKELDIVDYFTSLTNRMVFKTALADKSLSLKTETKKTDLFVLADKNELHRVFLNLFKNAMDFTPQKSELTLSMKIWKNNFVRVEVRDKGKGVDEEILPYLFKAYPASPLKRYHQVGMGLGLYLSKEIIEAHGGKIGYERVKDESVFFFILPLLQD